MASFPAPYQVTLASVLASSRQPLTFEQRIQAQSNFHRIVDHFRYAAIRERLNGAQLIRGMFAFARSDESRDIFLHAFFQSMDLSLYHDVNLHFATQEEEEELAVAFADFADNLVGSFFLPREIHLGSAVTCGQCAD